jgi:hypothetical protein
MYSSRAEDWIEDKFRLGVSCTDSVSLRRGPSLASLDHMNYVNSPDWLPPCIDDCLSILPDND